MRTTPEENTIMGRWIGEKLNACKGPVRLLVPEKGLSALDVEGGAFWAPDADAALFAALRATILDPTRLVLLPYHINEPAFAKAATDTFLSLMTVSYTHLDVYKRQHHVCHGSSSCI